MNDPSSFTCFILYQTPELIFQAYEFLADQTETHCKTQVLIMLFNKLGPCPCL